MLLEECSRNATQNADFTADILARRGIDRILLVTSALHMPRSKALFEAKGLEVITASTDHEIRALPAWRYWLPDTDALDGGSRVSMRSWGEWWAGNSFQTFNSMFLVGQFYTQRSQGGQCEGGGIV